MLTPSVRPPTLADTRAMISAAVVTPALSMSLRVMTCTGSAVSDSSRLIAEPVISTFGISAVLSACCAHAPCAASPNAAPSAITCLSIRLSLLC